MPDFSSLTQKPEPKSKPKAAAKPKARASAGAGASTPKKPRKSSKPASAAAAPTSSAPSEALEASPAGEKAKRFQLAYRVTEGRHKALQYACVDRGIKMQTLIQEAVDLWLDANGIEKPD